MNTFCKVSSALIVAGVLLAATMYWVSSNAWVRERPAAIALHSNVQSPNAIPAPAPPRESVLRNYRVANETIAHNAQPVAIPAPAHSK